MRPRKPLGFFNGDIGPYKGYVRLFWEYLEAHPLFVGVLITVPYYAGSV